jgi:integrase
MSVFRDKATGNWMYKFKFQGEIHRKKGFPTKKEALEKEAEKKKELKTPPPAPEPEKPTTSLRKLVSAYLDNCRPRYGKNTTRAKEAYFQTFAAYLGDDLPVDEITSTKVNSFILKVAERDGNKNGNRHLKDLKAMWNWGKKQEEMGILKNPCDYVEPLPEDPHIKYVPPLEDVDKLLLAAKPEQMEFIQCVFFLAGRVGEVLKLKWEDVNFDRLTVTLWTKKRKGGGYKAQRKPMLPQVEEILKRKWKARDKEQPWVFINPRTKKPYSERPRWMNAICTRAKIKPFEFHNIRHAVAHRLDDSGKASLRQIRDLLGHNRVTTTDEYLRSMSTDLMEVAMVLGEREEKVEEESEEAT